MRISDWSSDVCSSDLDRPPAPRLDGGARLRPADRRRRQARPRRAPRPRDHERAVGKLARARAETAGLTRRLPYRPADPNSVTPEPVDGPFFLLSVARRKTVTRHATHEQLVVTAPHTSPLHTRP